MKKFQILNFKFKIPRVSESGFTLVEMLTVIAIFVVIGVVAMSILITSFRTSQKTDIITLVQQNGTYALTQMAKTIRDARGLVSPFPCSPVVNSSSLSILTPDDQEITYSCGGQPPTIASNGASILDTNTVALQSCSFTCMQQTDSDLPIIQINFSLQQQSNSKFAERTASASAVNFQTSVDMRNINR